MATAQELATALGIVCWTGEPGHCFLNVLEFAKLNPEWFIVHGIVKPESGESIGHAWCERKIVDPTECSMWVVYCPSQSARSVLYKGVVARDRFYQECRVSFVKRYDLARAIRLAEKFGFCGPWNPTVTRV
jgi:hypothetical protein